MDDPQLTARKVDLCIEHLSEIERLLPLPEGVPGRTDRICALAGSIANEAPHGGIADLARKVRSEAQDPKSRRMWTYIVHLKGALDAVKAPR